MVLQGTSSKDVTEMGKAPTSFQVASAQQRKYGATCCAARGLTSRTHYTSSLAFKQFSKTPSIKYDRMVEIKSMATVSFAILVSNYGFHIYLDYLHSRMKSST